MSVRFRDTPHQWTDAPRDPFPSDFEVVRLPRGETPPLRFTDPQIAAAFVAGILEAGAERGRAFEVIEEHCAERGQDPALMVKALLATGQTRRSRKGGGAA